MQVETVYSNDDNSGSGGTDTLLDAPSIRQLENEFQRAQADASAFAKGIGSPCATEAEKTFISAQGSVDTCSIKSSSSPKKKSKCIRKKIVGGLNEINTPQLKKTLLGGGSVATMPGNKGDAKSTIMTRSATKRKVSSSSKRAGPKTTGEGKE
jgi:hypothetical protein